MPKQPDNKAARDFLREMQRCLDAMARLQRACRALVVPTEAKAQRRRKS